ncbi:MAG TPA: molecular chaperone DnaJ [Firmicutes bacterium]|nr:molecular chaperone DnaJ [Bacillota bacterium]
MSVKDYYKILNVAETAPIEEIKKQYRKLVRKYHPDKNPGDKRAEEKFKEINEAYEILSNQQKRQQYDTIRKYGSRFSYRGAGPAGGPNFNSDLNLDEILRNFSGKRRKKSSGGSDSFNDIFSQFFDFNDISSQDIKVPKKGKDLLTEITIPFETAVKGGFQYLTLELESICSHCSGTGSEPGSVKNTCPRCLGKGTISVNQGLFGTSYVCPECQGKGEIIKNPCKTCRGSGRVISPVTVKVVIPKGIDDNSKIRLRGKGGPGINNGPPGDLIIRINIQPHSTFKRDGLDIEVETSILLTDALLGTEITVPTMDGKVKLKVPAGTPPNTRLRLRGKGVPSASGRGDLYIKILVKFPAKLTEEQLRLIKQLKESGI